MSNLKISQTKKSLESRKIKLQTNIAVLKRDLKDIEENLCRHKKKLKDINEQLAKINIIPNVTEHAILRYLERYHDINIDSIKNKILSENLITQINALNSGKFPIQNGLTAVVKNKSIVSII